MTTCRARLSESSAPALTRVWMPGPDVYHFRIAIRGVTTPLQTPLVLQLLDDSDPPKVLAEATGVAPYRDDINDILTSSVITRPLLEQLRHATRDEEFDVVIDVNLKAADRREAALAHVRDLVNTVTAGRSPSERGTEQYVFERLTKAEIEELVRVDVSSSDDTLRGSIHRVWPDFQVHALIDRSISTIKADAARPRSRPPDGESDGPWSTRESTRSTVTSCGTRI